MVFQDYALFPHLTVGENVMFGLDTLPRRERRPRALEVLSALELGPKIDRYPHELSGGQQQRVALARAIAPRPHVVLMDEPFSNLDAHLRDQVRDEVVAILREAQMTSVFVSHDQRDALAISDQVVVMNRGCVEQKGTPQEIYRHPESIFVANFVGRTNLLAGVVQSEAGCVLTDFGSFCRVDRLGMPNGSQVVVSVRPDGFLLQEGGQLKGTLESVIFTGAQLEAEVSVPSALGGHRRLLVHLPPSGRFSTGDTLAFRLNPDYASVVRNACQVFVEEGEIVAGAGASPGVGEG
jgi:iron(III) transport system ATP-binding protein